MIRKAFFFWIALSVAACGISGCGNKREIEAAFGNAEWLETKGRYREAIAQYETVLKIAPRSEFSGIARMKIGEIYFKRLRDYDSARSLYRMVLNLYPDSAYAHVAAKQLKEMEKLVRIKTAALNEGDRLLDQGRFREAIEKYSFAQSLEPCNRFIKEKLEIAQERYDEKGKQEASAATVKGDMYFSRKKYEEAISEYILARELTPDDEEIWDKLELAMAKLAPIKRERSFEKARASGKVLDLDDPGSISIFIEKLKAPAEAASPGEAANGSVERDTYCTDFSISLPDYKHYFQGYKFVWRPGDRWSMIKFQSREFYFPFLKVSMSESEEFESLCSKGTDAGSRPSLHGAALFQILGRDERGGISAQLIDARLEVPGRGYLYVRRKKSE